VFPILALSLALGAPAAETNAPPKAADLTELPLEALMNIEVPKVYGASKLEQKVTEAPSSVTIVTADEVKRYGYRTLADILESAPGCYVSYDRNNTFLGTRGVSLGDFNDRILLLVDGHRVNNNYNDGAAIGTDFIPGTQPRAFSRHTLAGCARYSRLDPIRLRRSGGSPDLNGALP